MNTSDSAPAETTAAQENATDLRQAAAFTAEEVHERTWGAIEWVLANPAYAWVSLIYVVAVFDGGCVVAAGVMCAAIFWGWPQWVGTIPVACWPQHAYCGVFGGCSPPPGAPVPNHTAGSTRPPR